MNRLNLKKAYSTMNGPLRSIGTCQSCQLFQSNVQIQRANTLQFKTDKISYSRPYTTLVRSSSIDWAKNIPILFLRFRWFDTTLTLTIWQHLALSLHIFRVDKKLLNQLVTYWKWKCRLVERTWWMLNETKGKLQTKRKSFLEQWSGNVSSIHSQSVYFGKLRLATNNSN